MSKYTFTFKKDDIYVEFVTTDKEIVERQFQIWVSDADDYAKSDVKKKLVKEPSNQNLVKKEILEQPQKEITEEPQEKVMPQPEEKQVETVVEESEEKIQLVEEVETPAPEVLDKASTLLRTINTIQNPPKEEVKPVETANFEEVLDKSIDNSTFEPSAIKDQVFLSFVKSKNTTDKFNYLIITAYYLSEFEKMDRFSLKQINSKLMQNLSTVIDHSTLQEAINQKLIEAIPDLTGVAEVAEYRLTLAGEDFFVNKI